MLDWEGKWEERKGGVEHVDKLNSFQSDGNGRP